MAVATFDTLKFANTLKAVGVPDKQAEAQAVAFAEMVQVKLRDFVTKDDLERFAAHRSTLLAIRWLFAATFIGIIASLVMLTELLFTQGR